MAVASATHWRNRNASAFADEFAYALARRAGSDTTQSTSSDSGINDQSILDSDEEEPQRGPGPQRGPDPHNRHRPHRRHGRRAEAAPPEHLRAKRPKKYAPMASWAKRARDTPLPPLEDRLMRCMFANGGIYIKDIGRIVNTLAFILKKRYASLLSRESGPEQIDIVLVQHASSPDTRSFFEVLFCLPARRGFSLRVLVNTRTFVEGDVGTTRDRAIEGLRNKIEIMAANL